MGRRTALTLSILEGIFGAAHVALTTGAVLTGVLILFGASARGFAWAQAVAVLAQAAPIVLAGVLQAPPRERAIAALLVSRLLWVPALLVPLRAAGVVGRDLPRARGPHRGPQVCTAHALTSLGSGDTMSHSRGDSRAVKGNRL